MDECDEFSDVEMVPLEAKDRPGNVLKSVVKMELQALDDDFEKPIGTFTTGVDIFSKEERLKMEERAKRFGLTEKIKDLLPDREIDLYGSMGIMDDGENPKNARLNVIHMRGTEEMSTKDVFKYFQDYAPQSIEWINDVSCNIVWFDNLSAARAMLGLSKKILSNDKGNDESENKKNSDKIVDEENQLIETINNGKEEDCINIKDINYPLPPGLWRKGIDCPKSKGIFLRFANKMDRKQANAEKLSKHYKKHENPHFGGVKGILTESRKRLYKQTRQSKHKLIIDDKDQNQTKNPWGALSETWGLNDVVEDDFLPKNDIKEQGRSIKERLGVKYTEKDSTREEESGEASSNSDSEEDWCKRSKIPRMRMHADDEEEKVQKRRAKIRYQMILNHLNKSNDLRSKLGKAKTKTQFRDAIQVVVTNTHLTKSSSLKRDNNETVREKDREIVEEMQPLEREEGEWQESDNEDGQASQDEKEQGQHEAVVENEIEIEEEEEGEHKEQDEDSIDEDSNIPAMEVQGPKGSVIKVVPPKPRIASTVWARLNQQVKSKLNDSYLKERQSGSRDLRSALKCGDLRSRIGNHTRGRSPLRIEVKNNRYTKDKSDTE